MDSKVDLVSLAAMFFNNSEKKPGFIDWLQCLILFIMPAIVGSKLTWFLCRETRRPVSRLLVMWKGAHTSKLVRTACTDHNFSISSYFLLLLLLLI